MLFFFFFKALGVLRFSIRSVVFVCVRLKVILTTGFNQRVPGCSPLALIPAALRDGGQLRDVSVAVQVLGGAAGHDPLQPSVVGFAALGRGVVRQAQGHALAPEQELAVGDLKAKASSA